MPSSMARQRWIELEKSSAMPAATQDAGRFDRLRVLVTEVRCCNSGFFTPDPRINHDTQEMLTILQRLDTQEECRWPLSL